MSKARDGQFHCVEESVTGRCRRDASVLYAEKALIRSLRSTSVISSLIFLDHLNSSDAS
jgi:hypothetical protein